MPHIIIEYSDNLDEVIDIEDLVDAVHSAALSDGLPALNGLRTRAAARKHYRVADGTPEFAFVALLARMGPGRSSTEKKRFLGALVDAVEAVVDPHRDRCPVSLSVEIQEIDPEMRVNRNHVADAMAERG